MFGVKPGKKNIIYGKSAYNEYMDYYYSNMNSIDDNDLDNFSNMDLDNFSIMDSDDLDSDDLNSDDFPHMPINSHNNSKKSSNRSYRHDKQCLTCRVDPSNPDTVPKFIDNLTIPEVLKPNKTIFGIPYYEIEMRQVKQRLHSFFPETKVWGYNGTYPGPTIETLRDRKIYVKWINKLPYRHLLPIDRTLHGTSDTPEVRTVVHLHGANIEPDSDGYPEAWFTRDYRETGAYFSRKIYKYTNHQQAATLWYHDHAIGITRLNVYSGLAGFYIIRDYLEHRLGLPSGKYEIPLLIQDRSFNKDGSLLYPSEPAQPVPEVYPSVVPAFIGNTILVNGKVWPYLNVEPRKYRFRLLNGSNTRTYTLSLSNGKIFHQIGSDGGLLSEPVELSTLIIAPAERADIIIDFSYCSNESLALVNADPDPHTSQVMQFRVNIPLANEDKSKIPDILYPVMPIDKKLASMNRELRVAGGVDSYGRPMLLLDNKMWDDPVSERIKLDSIEIWNLVNITAFPHPIHVHLVQFQILDRRPFDVNYYLSTGKIRYIGEAIEPDDNEKGWKDTVRVTPGQVTRIIAHFKEHTGRYVWHCHILEHEDHDMMRPFVVE